MDSSQVANRSNNSRGNGNAMKVDRLIGGWISFNVVDDQPPQTDLHDKVVCKQSVNRHGGLFFSIYPSTGLFFCLYLNFLNAL